MKKIILYFLLCVSSALQATQAYISPSETSVGTNTLTLILSNSLLSFPSNSGINWIKISLPQDFYYTDPITNSIKISNYWNNGTVQSLVSTQYSAAWPSDGYAMVTNSGSNLTVYLANQVTNTVNSTIYISMTLYISNDFTTREFISYIDAVQLDSMSSVMKSNQATCGPQKTGSNAAVSLAMQLPESFASITPNSIYQGESPYTFTYKIKTTPAPNRKDIRYAVIKIPDAFTNSSILITNTTFDSTEMGTSETNYISISNNHVITGLSSGNFIFLNYTAAPLSPGESDVLTFQVAGTPEILSNQAWQAWVDYNPISSASSNSKTNEFYPSQMVDIGSMRTVYPWDISVISATNYAPVSVKLTNTNAFARFNIIKDGETNTEAVNQVEIYLGGNNQAVRGFALLYKETNGDGEWSLADKLIEAKEINNPAAAINFNAGGDTDISVSNDYPTRFYIAISVTNKESAVFTNSLRVNSITLACQGAQSGLVNNSNFLFITNSSQQASKIDTHLLLLTNITVISNTVKQGSFNNVFFKMVFSNTDPDATNFFSGLIISNRGTAGTADLGLFTLFRDNDDGNFNEVSDEVIMAAALGTDNIYRLSTAIPVELYSTNARIFWGTFNVKNGAGLDKTIDLAVMTNTNIIFNHTYNDQSDSRPFIQSVWPNPDSFTGRIIPSESQDYDFYLKSISYSLPASFSTNQITSAAAFSVYMDVENTNNSWYPQSTVQVFRGVTVHVSNFAGNTAGEARLYMETNGDNIFSTNADLLIASNAAVNGVCFLTNLFISNLSADQNNPAWFYLAYTLTNSDISIVKSENMGLRITNMLCAGPNGGVFDNLSLLTSTAHKTGNIDSLKVNVNYVSNAIVNIFPKQGSFNNPYLRFAMAGDDTDATNYLSWVDVFSNQFTTVSNSHIPAVKLYLDNDNNVFSTADDTPLAVNSFTAAGTRLSLSTPLAMPGTNVKTFFAVFDVSSEDTNAVGKYLGLRISNVSFGFSDGLNDGFAQNSFISEFNHGPDFATNICISALTARDWDFKIISSANCAPVSIGISNLYALSYFDIVGDGENTSTEKITNITVGLYGKKSDLAGDLLLYRDTNIVSVLSNHDKLTGSNAVSAPSVAGFSLNESGISTDPLNPDRFWIGIYITNHAAGIYTNTVLANITNVLCSGPNNGILTNFEILTNVSTNYSRIDNYLVYASASNVLSSSVEQGSFNNVAFALRLSNSDPDAQYYFNSLRVTNTGTATNSDLGSFQLFRDNGDGVFSSALDTVIANASSLTGKEYILSFTPQIITNDLLWGLFNVDFSSAVNNTVALAVAGASGSNVLGFYDNFSDNYSLLPTCSAPAQIPASPYSAVIIPYSSKPYDFYLFSLDYSSMPQSFTSNQYIQAAAMEVFMDTEQPDQQYFTGLDVNLGSTKSSNQIFGIADLYKESSGNTTFSIADTLLASTNIAAGGSFSLSLSNSNITSSTDQPDRLYLVFRLTNNVELAKTNTVFFKITNIYCSGPNGGVFTNKQLLTNFSREARIDNGKVIVNYITNYQEPAKPKQASFNNIFLKMSLQGDDPDGTNYISHVDVKSNNSSSVNFAFGHIPYVKIFDASKTVLSYQSFTGCERITLNPPVALAGTNETILYAGYDVSSSSSVVSNTFGMELTNNSIGLVDNISDNFSQYIWSAGSYSGPSPVSNVTIASISSQPWDIYIQNAVNAAPKSIRVSNVYGMTYVEVIADSQESMIAQKITNFKVALEGYCSEVKGQLLLYRDTNDANNMSAYSFSTNDCLLLTNIYFSDYQATNNLVSFQSNLSGTATEPTRFWIGLKLTNYENNIYTNKIRIRTVDIEASGPDNGIVTNKNILTYSSAALANVDSYQLNLYAQSTNTNNSVKQGSFNNLAFRMVFVNSDTDATNYFSGMIITNVGITGASGVSNLGDFRLFRDDGDNIYSPSQDIVQGSASLNNESYSISLFTPAVLSGTSNVFWGVYDVKLDASTNMANYISLQIPSVSVTNNISFADQIIDSYGDYYQVPVLLTSGPYPAVTCSNSISPFNSLPFDFYLSEASYSAAPDAFTSNQYAPLGQIKVFRDLDNNPNLAFRGMDVQVNGSKANVSGEAFIYREASGTGFSTNTDEYICMTNVYSGNAFSLDCNMTNITMNVDSPDTLYLVFRLTNDIDTAKGDKFSFRITNLRVTGTDNVITNLSLLSSAAAKESRIDSFKVIVEYVSNNIEYYKPSVLLNPVNYLKIGIRGDDSDAVNYLSSLTINTNGLSDIDSDTISYIKLYTNSSGGSLKETFFSNSYGTFNLSPPLAVNGSTMQELFIKYDISTASNSVGKKFGMEIRSNAWGFTDYISDNFSQNSFVSGSYAGPAFTTNILIISPAVKWWDFEAIESAKNEAPTQLVEGVEVPVMSFKMYRENETPGDSATWEYLTNITVSNVLNDYAFSGILKLYTNKASVDNWKSASQLSTNVLVSSGLPAVSFDFAKAYISYNAAESTRFYITYTAQNFHSAAQNSFKVLSIGSGGPNDGIINNSSGIIGFISEPIRCENRNIKIECTSYLPEKAKQGQKKVPALRMVINSIDADASFQLNSLYFDLGGTFGTNDLEKGLIYLDNGDTPGSLDDKDVFVDGSAGIFSSGKMQATFSTPMAITSTPKKLLLLLDIGEEAIIGNSFNVSFKKENQKGFAALTIDNTAYALTLGDYSPDTTGYCSILPGIQFKNKFTPAAASTVIDIAKNGKCQIYLSDELDYTAYKAAIFDVFGHKINDLAFPSHKLEWGGADFKGSVVRSGIYIIIVIGPDIHESFKVMVIK